MLLRRRALGDISNTEGEPLPANHKQNKRQRKSFEPPAIPSEDVVAAISVTNTNDNSTILKNSNASLPTAPRVDLAVVLTAPPLVLPPPVPQPICIPTPVCVSVAKKTYDPVQCTDIIKDMCQRWRELELQYSPSPYMNEQRDITFRMRGILVDWLVEVHYKFKLHGSSLWLTINLLDRYLQKVSIQRDRLQLVGVASLLIAGKFDEVTPPEVDECVHITDNSYSKRELLAMEYSIFESLDYQVCVPTGFSFISRYLSLIDADDTTKFLALFYAERNLQEQHFLNVLPSHLAGAAVFAALWKKHSDALGPRDGPLNPVNVWPAILVKESEYTAESLLPCARNLILHAGLEPMTTSQRRLIAAKKKYSQEKYLNIAALPLPVLP